MIFKRCIILKKIFLVYKRELINREKEKSGYSMVLSPEEGEMHGACS